MENEDILEQQALFKERLNEMAREELEKQRRGFSYNTPNTSTEAPPPEDKDEKVIDSAAQVLTGKPKTQQQEQPTEQPKESKNFHSDMKLDLNPAKWAYLSGMGALDVPFDVVGLVPGLGWLDDSWDDLTKQNNEGARKFRAAASIILPTIVTAGAYGKWVAAKNLPALTKAAMNVGGVGLINGAIASASDFGEDPENRFLTSPQNFKRLQEWWPEIFGPQGRYPLAEDLMKIDGIDPELNRILIGIEETVFSGVGDIIGYGFNMAKPLLWKVKPLSEQSAAVKKATQIKYMEADTKKAISDIDGALETGALNKEQAEALVVKKARLIDQITKTGSSEVTGNPAESIIRDKQRSRQAYTDQRAVRKIIENPWGKEFDADITPKLASDTQQTSKPYIPGAAWRNTIDVTAQEAGEYSRNAVPTRPYTDAAKDKALKLGEQHTLVAGVAKKVRQMPDYVDFQNKFRESDRFNGAMGLYEKIMPFGTGAKLSKILTSKDYLTTTSVLGKDGIRREIQYLNPDGLSATGLAMSDLLNLYVGKETQATSARVMSTLGKEISAMSNGAVTYKGLMDEELVYKNILDRVELLEAEYGKAKFAAGWTLENAAFWKRFQMGDVTAEEVDNAIKEINRGATKSHENFKKLRQTLEELDKTGNKKLSQVLKEAYDYSDGDINTILSLDAWAKKQVNPGGLAVSSDRGMNLFAKGAWAVVYNNVLSGLSPLRALVGNGVSLILRPMTTFARAGIKSIFSGSTEPWERAIYLHSSMFETTRRAWNDMTARMAKVHSDPDALMRTIRKDYVIEEDNAYKIIDDYSEQWEKDGDHWNSFFWGWAKTQRAIARMKWMRTGMTGMAGIDAYTDTFMATFISRVRAYDEVFGKFKNTLDPVEFKAKLIEAEKINYGNMFDKDRVLTDQAAKSASGEIALNLDDGISTWLNAGISKVPAMKVFMMFPRTGINQIKQAISYTPIGMIPGIKSKYAKVLQAGDDPELIKKALAAHGMKTWDDVPNAMAIYKQLKDEYEGRIMVGSATAIMGFWYAMSGNIRGNGPVNAKERQDLMRKGWRPYTVNVGGNWISYKGVPMVEQMFSLVGDMAYYQNALGTNLTESLLSKFGWTISATYLNNTPLYGIEPIMAAINGDESAIKRTFANIARGVIPASGAFGVVANAITQAQKDIYNDMRGYVLNSTPFKQTLPSQIDHWTGEQVNEVDNHLLRMLNAISPVKVSGGEEPWRLWLLNSGFDDIGFLRKKTGSDVDYNAEERELIGKFMGEDQLWKEVERMRTNKKWNKQLNDLRQLMKDPTKSKQEVMAYRKNLPVYQHLRKILRKSQLKAEARIAMDPRYRHLDIQGKGRAITKKYMEKGLVEAAKNNADTNQRINDLLNLPNR